MRSSLRMYIALTIAFCGFGMTQPAHAQDLEGCDQIERLVEAGDYPAALVELGWCQRDITELHYQAILEVLEVTVLGYEPGEGKVSAAMGFSTIEITHSDGSNEIKDDDRGRSRRSRIGHGRPRCPCGTREQVRGP